MNATLEKPAIKKVTVRVATADLKAALNSVKKAINRHTTVPILSNVKLSTSPFGYCLYVESTDLEVRIKEIVPLIDESSEKFAVTVNPKMLEAVLTGSVTTLTQDGPTSLQTDTGSLNALPADEYPPGLELDGPTSNYEPDFAIEVKWVDLHRALTRCRMAADSELRGQVLMGTKLEVCGTSASIITTDGYRLSKASFPVEHNANVEVILPKSAVDMIHKIKLTRANEEAMVFLEGFRQKEDAVVYGQGRMIRFQAPNAAVYTFREVDGQYPNYRQVIPSTGNIEANLDIPATVEVLKRAKLVASSGAYMVKLDFAIDRLTIRAESGDNGTFEQSIPYSNHFCLARLEPNADLKMTVAFNCEYLLSALDAFKLRTAVPLRLLAPLSPAVFGDPGSDDLVVLMPLRG